MKSINYCIILILFAFCSTTEDRLPILQPVTVFLPPCSCTAMEIKPIAARKILDTGLEEYSSQKKIILDTDVEEELLSIPQVFLYDLSILETKKNDPSDSGVVSKEKISWKATAKLSEPKIETFLKEKKVEEINGTRVYTNRNSGNRALELIQNFSRERQKERKLDRDKYYKDRVDMLERAKSGIK